MLIRTIIAAGIAVAAVTATGCGGDGEKEFATPTYPFSFSYPSGWTLTRNAAFSFGSGTGERSLSIALKEPNDQVTITQYKLRKTLPAGVNGNQREVDRVVARLTAQAKGTASESKAVSYGGIPGYEYVVEYEAADKTVLRNMLVFLFKGKDEFQVNCQSSPKNREELEKGCKQVLDTLKFS
ncbi:MAG: hypothetical protein Q7R41_14180 [Phycisphaerales bacterium]|nr:hypothetical protein [Phycisphaerales bacterium]